MKYLRAKFCKSGAGGDSLKFSVLSFLDIWLGLMSYAKSQNIEV